MPSNAGAWSVFDCKAMLQAVWIHASEDCGEIPIRRESFGKGICTLKPAALKIIVPAKRDRAALAKIAAKGKGLEIKGSNNARSFGLLPGRDDVVGITDAYRQRRAVAAVTVEEIQLLGRGHGADM